MSSLAEAYPEEQARCRELRGEYRNNPKGAFSAVIIDEVLTRADKAVKFGDIEAMRCSLEEMKACK